MGTDDKTLIEYKAVVMTDKFVHMLVKKQYNYTLIYTLLNFQ